VNGLATRVESTDSAPAQEDDAGTARLTYLGPDGNVWALDWPGGTPRQITTDATGGSMEGETVIDYYFPAISSDGRLIAYRRDEGIPIASGLEYHFGLFVHDGLTGQSSQWLEDLPAGFAWQPGTHVLAYGKAVPTEYFLTRGQPAPELAQGIWAADLDSGEVRELVSHERGYALRSPTWSRDGGRLAFEEVINMEGSGWFAYYDLATGEYSAWEESLGIYDWSPDGQQIAYDRLTYSPTGTESIVVRDLAGPDSPRHMLMVQSLAGGDPRALGEFEIPLNLAWAPGGAHLVFSAGPIGEQQLMAVDPASGSSAVLAPGTAPDFAGG
jgi:Tol biopolymer transport system component